MPSDSEGGKFLTLSKTFTYNRLFLLKSLHNDLSSETRMKFNNAKNVGVGLFSLVSLSILLNIACAPSKTSKPTPGSGSNPTGEGQKQAPSGHDTEQGVGEGTVTGNGTGTGNDKPGSELPSDLLTTPANFKVAFVGDQGVSEGSHAVLKLIKSEKTDLLIIPGDFDYEDSPDQWDKMLTDTVGDMPILASIGNHDVDKWSGYSAKLKARLDKMPKAKCTGELGIKHRCEYEGLVIAISAVGTKGDRHEEFIEQSLSEKKAAFSICVWHKNQTMMQVGSKEDETGWKVYETCREHGAIVATAHEHSYSRTFLMSNFEKQTVASRGSDLVLDAGHSFAFVSGLGGKSIREEGEEEIWQKILKALKGDKREPEKGDWWAKVYTANQNANYGALFCTFHVDNDPRKARCEFKNITGDVVDTFQLISKN